MSYKSTTKREQKCWIKSFLYYATKTHPLQLPETFNQVFNSFDVFVLFAL